MTRIGSAWTGGVALLVALCGCSAEGDAGGAAANGGAGAEAGAEAGGDASCEPGVAPATPVATESLADYCARASCPSYEEALARRSGGCDSDAAPPWVMTKQDGCGQILLGWDVGLGSGTYVFDAVSRELIGVRSSSDTPVDACGHYILVAGAPVTCSEGDVCTRCGEDVGECVAACSLDAWRRRPGAVPYGFDQVALQSCVGLAENERPRLVTGCGRITASWAENAVVFEEATHEVVGARATSAWAVSGACAGQWGEPEAPCSDVTSCSLCSDDPDRCAL